MSSQVEGVVLRGPHAVEANVELALSACVHRCVRGVQMCQVCTGVSAVLSQATWCGFSLATSSRMEAGWGAPVRHWARVSKDPRTMLQQLSKNEGCRAGLAITLRVRFKM